MAKGTDNIQNDTGGGEAWLVATVSLKLSILFLYGRIFTTMHFKRAMWVMVGVVGAYGVTFFCVFLTDCFPIWQSWDPVPKGWCRSEDIEELTSVSVNMVIDLAIVFLPMWPLWGLQIPLHKKLAISLMFSIGFLYVISPILR